jgi:hypothetical protein
MILAGIRASFQMFNGAWDKVMRSPTGWHDRTPVSLHMIVHRDKLTILQTGRIINRLSKGDQYCLLAI